MKYNDKNKPVACMMTQSTCYKNTSKMVIKGVCWHDTGCNNPNVKRYVQPSDNASDKQEMLKLLGVNTYHNDWNHTDRKAGVNAFIGKLADGTVATVQTMPWNYRPWGVGSGKKGSLNDGWIQFEICEDAKTDRAYATSVYKEACELTAYLCKLYGIDPNATVKVNGVNVPTVLCHKDAANLGFGCDHGDIYDWFPIYGYNMETARKDVAALIKGSTPTPTPTPTPAQTITIDLPPTIKNGSKGKAVKVWQSIMGVSVDGIFGANTENATKGFQGASNLTADGIVGKDTWTKGLNTL